MKFILGKLIRKGHLRFIGPDGRMHGFGNLGEKPSVVIRFSEPYFLYKLPLNFSLYMGEAYMDGKVTFEEGGIFDVLKIFAMNYYDSPPLPGEGILEKLQPVLQLIQQYNPVKKSRENVAHHYDLSDALYRLFLDSDMQYSCAYFVDPSNDLEQAQEDKKRHIAAKLLLKPGMRVLDIGCGWGGMALYLAKNFGVHVTGITLSKEQLKVARERAKEMGLENKVQFHLRDYRHETIKSDEGGYDRIVSVGMFEHVGISHYREFFAKIKNLLRSDGVALLHSIGRMDGPGTTDPWLRKYIFPGGYAPALSEVLPVVEKSGLWATDIEILRLHYAETLKAWRAKFMESREKIAAIYDERFCRMWEFYLIGAEMDFRYLSTMVFQIQLAKDISAVPLTRNYLYQL